jgi:hypothetical protein
MAGPIVTPPTTHTLTLDGVQKQVAVQHVSAGMIRKAFAIPPEKDLHVVQGGGEKHTLFAHDSMGFDLATKPHVFLTKTPHPEEKAGRVFGPGGHLLSQGPITFRVTWDGLSQSFPWLPTTSATAASQIAAAAFKLSPVSAYVLAVGGRQAKAHELVEDLGGQNLSLVALIATPAKAPAKK